VLTASTWRSEDHMRAWLPAWGGKTTTGVHEQLRCASAYNSQLDGELAQIPQRQVLRWPYLICRRHLGCCEASPFNGQLSAVNEWHGHVRVCLRFQPKHQWPSLLSESEGATPYGSRSLSQQVSIAACRMLCTSSVHMPAAADVGYVFGLLTTLCNGALHARLCEAPCYAGIGH
jgi:hypothetical protein